MFGFEFFVLLLWQYLCLSRASPSSSNNNAGGKCRGLWRPEKLVGRCFGLTNYRDYLTKKQRSISIPISQNITTAAECRALCCHLEENCVSWQFESTQPACKIGGIVRLGMEATGTPEWCDPFPDSKWNGHILLSRSKPSTSSSSTSVCTWGEAVPKQCYGLGPERQSATKQPLDAAGCAQACCDRSDCGIWQQVDGRGCYFSPRDEASCSTDPERIYTGGRKCLPGFCGGLEEKILGTGFNKTTTTTTTKISSHLR